MKGVFTLLGIVVCAVLVGLAPQLTSAGEEAKQAEVVAGELGAFAKHLGMRPESAIDRTAVSGEYCLASSYIPRTPTRIRYGFPSP